MLNRRASNNSDSIVGWSKSDIVFNQLDWESRFYNNFKQYIELLKESWDISDWEYIKIQDSLATWKFKRFCQVCARTEWVNMWIMKPLMYVSMPTIYAITEGNPALTMVPYAIDRTSKIAYGYPIARMWKFKHPFIFSCSNAFPIIWKYLTPAFCIAKDHKEISKYTASYIKEKVLFTLSLPNSQRIMSLIW